MFEDGYIWNVVYEACFDIFDNNSTLSYLPPKCGVVYIC